MSQTWSKHFKQSSIALLVFAAALTMQACQKRLTPQSSCNFVQNADLQRVSWKSAAPARLLVHQSVPTQAYASIQLAADIINQTIGRELIHIELWGVSGSPQPEKDGYSVIYWMNQWEPDRTWEQARTTIYWTGAYIQEADLRINATLSLYLGENTGVTTEIDLVSLLVHEFGHVLGLGHFDKNYSIMNSNLANGQERRSLMASDVSSLKCEY